MADKKLTLNDAGTHVLMKHSETGGVWFAPLDFVPVAGQLGWEPTTQEEDPLAGLVDRPDEGLFDPSAPGVTVAQINDHLAANAESNPGEVIRVLDLERAGKKRTSIVVPDGFDPIA